MQTSACACWALRDFSDQREVIVPNFFHNPYYFYYAIFYNAKFHKKVITL